jgi:hypothetical protein
MILIFSGSDIVAIIRLTNLSPQNPIFMGFPVDRVPLMRKALHVTDNIYNLRGLQVASSSQFSDNTLQTQLPCDATHPRVVDNSGRN